MADEKLVVEIVLDDGSIQKGFINLEKKAAETAKKTDNSFLGMTGAVAIGNQISKAFDRAVETVKELGSEALRSAKEAENSLVRLANSYALNGKYSKAAVSEFDAFTDALERQTGISADLINNQAATLSSLTGLTGEGLEKATKAALNLSQATGKDLSSSIMLLTRAGNGGEEALKKYGIQIDKNLPESQKFAAAIEQINTKFKDLAQTRLNTYEGLESSLDESFGHLLEQFGNMIVLSPTIRGIMKFLIDNFYALGDAIESFFKGDPLAPLIDGAIRAGLAFSEGLLPPVEVFFNLFKTGAYAISFFASEFALGIAQINKAFLEYIVFPITSFFGDKLASLIGAFSSDAETKLRSVGDRVMKYYRDASENTVNNLSQLATASADATVTAANSVLDTKFSEFANNKLKELQNKISEARLMAAAEPTNQTGVYGPDNNPNTVGSAFDAIATGMEERVASLNKNFKENFKQIGVTMYNTLVTGAGNAFSALGKAIVTGENKLEAFANAMLAAFGQAAVQLGTQFILQGIAMTWAGWANGPALIAAGSALATFGGILSALGGSQGASANTAPGGASSTPGSVGVTGDLPVETLDSKPKTDVHVVVEGNIYNPKETAQNIAELIQQYVDSGDINAIGVPG